MSWSRGDILHTTDRVTSPAALFNAGQKIIAAKLVEVIDFIALLAARPLPLHFSPTTNQGRKFSSSIISTQKSFAEVCKKSNFALK